MRHARVWIGVLAALGCAAPARAQFVVGPPRPGVVVGYQSRRVVVGVAVGGYGSFSVVGPGPALGFGPPRPFGFGPTFSSINIITPPPNYQPPIIINNNFNNFANPPAADAMPARGEPLDFRDPIVIRPRNGMRDDPPLDLPGDPAGGFRPLRPEDRARAQPMPPAEGRPPVPEPDNPVAQGRQAFANQEYGRAARLFRLAVDLDATDPMAWFLLAEAQFAVGKYREAVASIHAGLKLDRDWPRGKFRPRELYGANVKDYAGHRDELRDALKRQPADAVLLFLSAYQLWFDGQQDEARVLFARARRLVADPQPLDLFLRGPAGDPVAQR